MQTTALLLGHIGEVRTCCLTRDGRLAVSGADDNSIRFWDAASGEQIAVMHMPNTAVAASADGSVIAVGDGTGNVSLFEFIFWPSP